MQSAHLLILPRVGVDEQLRTGHSAVSSAYTLHTKDAQHRVDDGAAAHHHECGGVCETADPASLRPSVTVPDVKALCFICFVLVSEWKRAVRVRMSEH